MDLKLQCKTIAIDGEAWDKINVDMHKINTSDLNTEEVAKYISPETFFEAHGEEAILQFVKENYDWFDAADE